MKHKSLPIVLALATLIPLTTPSDAQNRRNRKQPSIKKIEAQTIKDKFQLAAADCESSKPVEGCSIDLNAPMPKISCEFGIIDLIYAECKRGQVKTAPPPCYPAIARAAKSSGKVVIKVVVDENGKVIWAQVESGHPLLRLPALRAACHIQFEPYLCNGRAVKAADYISYTFESR